MPSSSRHSRSLAAVRKYRRGQPARRPELGLERLDSRLVLSASAQLFGRWLRLQPPAAIASAAAASTGTENAITLPKALTGSQASAFL